MYFVKKSEVYRCQIIKKSEVFRVHFKKKSEVFRITLSVFPRLLHIFLSVFPRFNNTASLPLRKKKATNATHTTKTTSDNPFSYKLMIKFTTSSVLSYYLYLSLKC